mgnify:FL=1
MRSGNAAEVFSYIELVAYIFTRFLTAHYLMLSVVLLKALFLLIR